MQEHTKFTAASGKLWGACCQLQQALLSLKAWGEEEQGVGEGASGAVQTQGRQTSISPMQEEEEAIYCDKW